MAVEVLVTAGDTDLGRTVAQGFREDGHKLTLVGAAVGFTLLSVPMLWLMTNE